MLRLRPGVLFSSEAVVTRVSVPGSGQLQADRIGGITALVLCPGWVNSPRGPRGTVPAAICRAVLSPQRPLLSLVLCWHESGEARSRIRFVFVFIFSIWDHTSQV